MPDVPTGGVTAPLRPADASTVRAPLLPTQPGPAYPSTTTPYTFPVATTNADRSGPSRRTWIIIGAVAAVVVAGSVAFVTLRPAPPSASGAVTEYFADLAKGETADALKLVDGYPGEIAPDQTPMLVPAALSTAASRPSDATIGVVKHNPEGDDSRYTTVAVSYKVGGHPVTQEIGVKATGDKTVPFALATPFVDLVVTPPAGLSASVNGIALDSDATSSGTPAFPGAYTATTDGNALLGSSTQSAEYQAGDDGGVMAQIEFGAPPLAATAQATVQQNVNQYLDSYCVNPSDPYSGQCPLVAPGQSYNTTTTWTIVSYPTVSVTPTDSDDSQYQAQFSTTTNGSAKYSVSYTDFDGTTHTSTGTADIDLSGQAGVGESGISIAFG